VVRHKSENLSAPQHKIRKRMEEVTKNNLRFRLGVLVVRCLVL